MADTSAWLITLVLQGYLAHKKQPPPQGVHRALGIGADPRLECRLQGLRHGVPPEDEDEDGERESFIDNLLVRIHFIIEMIWWTGLAPWEFEFPFPGSLTSTFQVTFLIVAETLDSNAGCKGCGTGCPQRTVDAV